MKKYMNAKTYRPIFTLETTRKLVKYRRTCYETVVFSYSPKTGKCIKCSVEKFDRKEKALNYLLPYLDGQHSIELNKYSIKGYRMPIYELHLMPLI